MRTNAIIVLMAVAAVLFVWNLHTILLGLPDELNQGAIFRIVYFHVAAAFCAFTGFFVSMVASALYLWRRNLRYDALAAGVTEVGAVFATINLITGMIWGRIIWGIWWTWDARLTSMLVCWLLYWGYVMMRTAIDEPTTRARLSAVLSLFAFVNVILVYKSIEWFRTQHPGPVLSIRQGGGMAPGMEAPIYWNFLFFLCVAAALVLLRMRQEATRHQIDAIRREAHAF